MADIQLATKKDIQDLKNMIKAFHPVTYGVSIDLANSNSETAVTYTDDAVGMVAGSADWYNMQIFNDIKPCLFKNGSVVGYLNPNNFAQFEDGTKADITSGNSGDVMIEIPKIGYKISKSGTTLTVQITDAPNKIGFSYKAHTRVNEGDRDKLYIGAFLGSNETQLRSLAHSIPVGNKSLGDFRRIAQLNGEGYGIISLYPLTLLQCLYLIMYKNLNSQGTLGMGYVGDTECLIYQKETGATITNGMDYRSNSNMEQMKFLGIEDVWGNLQHWIDGCIITTAYDLLIATDNMDSADSYSSKGKVENCFGILQEPQGDNVLGFIPKICTGSTSTYFSDYSTITYVDEKPNLVPIFGGNYWMGTNAGIFSLQFEYSSEEISMDIGARLMYL